MLVAHNISFGYNQSSLVIDDANIKIAPGEIVWLQGPSGSGKTTLCQLLAGYLEPLSGVVDVDAEALPKEGTSPVQYVGQHPELMLDPRMRMRDSLAEGGECSDHLLHHLGIQEKWMSRYPHELSGGEMQRFCLARALAANPKYLIADEVSTMLDALTQARIWHVLVDEAQKRNMGVLITTHSDALGEKLSTRKVRIDDLRSEPVTI